MRARCLPSTITFTVPSGSAHVLEDQADRADRVDVALRGLLLRDLPLRREQQMTVAAARLGRRLRSTSAARRRAARPCGDRRRCRGAGGAAAPCVCAACSDRSPSSLLKMPMVRLGRLRFVLQHEKRLAHSAPRRPRTRPPPRRLRREGMSYMMSSMIVSRIARRPRAPDLRFSACSRHRARARRP